MKEREKSEHRLLTNTTVAAINRTEREIHFPRMCYGDENCSPWMGFRGEERKAKQKSFPPRQFYGCFSLRAIIITARAIKKSCCSDLHTQTRSARSARTHQSESLLVRRAISVEARARDEIPLRSESFLPFPVSISHLDFSIPQPPRRAMRGGRDTRKTFPFRLPADLRARRRFVSIFWLQMQAPRKFLESFQFHEIIVERW